jgi:multiple sugar transport system substrate-binding protein
MRKILVLLVVLMVALSAVAFAGGQGEDMSAAGATEFTGEFDWQRFEGESIKLLLNQHPYTDGMLAELDTFEEMTGISVEYDIFPEEEYFNRVTVALSSSSTEYDAFMTGAYMVWQYAPPGWMEDLTPWIENPAITSPDYDFDDIIDNIAAGLRWNLEDGAPIGEGPQWALPWGFEGNTLMYNKRVFNELGLELPETLDDVIEMGRVIQAETDMIPIAVRGTRSWATIHPGFMTAYNSAGAQDYDEDMNPRMNSDIAVRFTEKWVEMVQEVGPPEWTSYTWYDVGNSLGAESAAMIYDADILGFFQNQEGASDAAGDLAWAAAPPGLDEPATTPNMWTWSIAMNSFSEAKGPAWYWLQWATSKEFLTTAAVEHATVNPVRASVWENPDFQARLENFDGYLEQYQNLIDGTGIHFTPQSRFFETTTEWAAALHEIYGGRDAQEALDELAEQLAEEF